MARKTFVTSTPNRTGAFMVASEIIAKHHANIVRVSYNKAVDLHTLFIDVVADEDALLHIAQELDAIGYLDNRITEINVLMIEVKIPDQPGMLLPVLKTLSSFDVNISYINSTQSAGNYQNFVLGLLIEKPELIHTLIDEIRKIYEVKILGFNDSSNCFDNSIFYIRLANEVQEQLHLSEETTLEFVSEANRVLQMLQRTKENPDKIFRYIREFMNFVSNHKGKNFQCRIDSIPVNDGLTLYCIEPVCGSNTYILKSPREIILIDTGYALYYEEMMAQFRALFPDWDDCAKKIYITHADVDHCGLLSQLKDATLYLNQKSADSLRRQSQGILDYRESREFCFGYSKLSRIISGYTPPDVDRAVIIDQNTPKEHDHLLAIGGFSIGGADFEILEGSGGHLYGEMVLVCRKYGILFTGDNFLNFQGFSSELQHFNSIAPYLMRSVNIDSKKAQDMRNEIIALLKQVEAAAGKSCLVCGGHGSVSVYEDGALSAFSS